MKYNRLTKEQFEEMHQEFIHFLASQSITKQEWDTIKKEKPEVAEEELDVFSDLVWEGVLQKVEYLEHFSTNHIYLFHIDLVMINLIAITVENESIDVTTREGYQWLKNNIMEDSVNLYTSSKAISDDRNVDIFALIKQGAVITKGQLYTYFEEIV